MNPESFILDVVKPPRIVVLNLDRRADRWSAMQEAWNPTVASLFVRHAAVDGVALADDLVEQHRCGRAISKERAAGELGCRLTWAEAAETFGPGLFFEDDARPCMAWEFGPPPIEAGVVLLGGNLRTKVADPGWAQVRSVIWGSHAVWIRTRRAANLLVHAWRNPESRKRSVDNVWEEPLRESASVVAIPQIVRQDLSLGTDVQAGWVRPAGHINSSQAWCSLEGEDPHQRSDLRTSQHLAR